MTMKKAKLEHVQVRISREEKKELRKAAHLRDVPLSQWVRATLLTEARKQ